MINVGQYSIGATGSTLSDIRTSKLMYVDVPKHETTKIKTTGLPMAGLLFYASPVGEASQ